MWYGHMVAITAGLEPEEDERCVGWCKSWGRWRGEERRMVREREGRKGYKNSQFPEIVSTGGTTFGNRHNLMLLLYHNRMTKLLWGFSLSQTTQCWIYMSFLVPFIFLTIPPLAQPFILKKTNFEIHPFESSKSSKPCISFGCTLVRLLTYHWHWLHVREESLNGQRGQEEQLQRQ